MKTLALMPPLCWQWEEKRFEKLWAKEIVGKQKFGKELKALLRQANKEQALAEARALRRLVLPL